MLVVLLSGAIVYYRIYSEWW